MHSVAASDCTKKGLTEGPAKGDLTRISARLGFLVKRGRDWLRENRWRMAPRKVLRGLRRRTIGKVTKRHHTIITGTGRAGTTFLVKLLTNLGLDTGYKPYQMELNPNCNAGLELDVRDARAPQIVKNPFLCDHIEEIVERRDIAIDYAIVPTRALEAAAESRRQVTRASGNPSGGFVPTPGGLWHTSNPDEQELVLSHQLYKLMVGLSKLHATVILLHYPRLTHDAPYLYEKLRPILGRTTRSRFTDVFEKTVDRSLVHKYTEDDV
jgi:hypothetical protein